MMSLVLELAVYQATQYKSPIFFKHENRSETTLFMGSFIQQKIASAREASPCADSRRNLALEPKPYFRHV